MTFRTFRISLLLLVLAAVGGVTVGEGWLVPAWLRPLQVVIYPIDRDGDPATRAYLEGLDAARFAEIAKNFSNGRRGAIAPNRCRACVSRWVPRSRTPRLRRRRGRVARSSRSATVSPCAITRFAARHFWIAWGGCGCSWSISKVTKTPLPPSLGLQKGLLGVVYVYARPRQDAQNTVVIAHELLHTLGASDKYDARGLPRFPDGYADPDAVPRHPQHKAESMAGRMATTSDHAVIPASLAECVVGPKTAYEINW